MEAPPVTKPKVARGTSSEDAVEKRARRQASRAEIAVHSFPARPTVVEPHILKSADAIALRPMTVEEAVKEAEFRDRAADFPQPRRRPVRPPSPPRRPHGTGGIQLIAER